MPWKETDSNEEGPPDLQELIAKIKDKVKESFQSKNQSANINNSDELVSVPPHQCAKCEKGYFVELFIRCSTCSKKLKKVSIKNPYKVATLLAVVSFGASQFVDYVVTDNRYPLDVEYAVLDACVNAAGSVISYGVYGSKKKLCLCALEETMNEISYIRYMVNEEGFLQAFKENAKACK